MSQIEPRPFGMLTVGHVGAIISAIFLMACIASLKKNNKKESKDSKKRGFYGVVRDGYEHVHCTLYNRPGTWDSLLPVGPYKGRHIVAICRRHVAGRSLGACDTRTPYSVPSRHMVMLLHVGHVVISHLCWASAVGSWCLMQPRLDVRKCTAGSSTGRTCSFLLAVPEAS